MQAILDKVTKLHENRFEFWKSSARPKIGWVSIHTPEEIIHAAGMIPFRITGETSSDTSSAASLLHRNICSYALSCLQEGMTGVYDFMDGFVTVDTCNSRKRLYDVWNHFLKHQFKYCLFLPRFTNDFYRNFFRTQIQQFIEALKSHFNCDISETSLLKSIDLFNQARAQVQALYNFRKRNIPGITGSEVQALLRSGMTGLQEEFVAGMPPVLEKLAATEQTSTAEQHRVLICGSYFDHPNLMEAIEKTGAVVVCEDNSNGLKYFDKQVAINLPPVQAISDYYFDKATSACTYDTDKRLNNLLGLIKEYNVQSVVYFSLKFCDPNLIDYPYIRQKLNETNIPVLYVETERHLSNMESIRTRIQSFFETKVMFAGARK